MKNNPGEKTRQLMRCDVCGGFTPHINAQHHSGERLAQCKMCHTFKPFLAPRPPRRKLNPVEFGIMNFNSALAPYGACIVAVDDTYRIAKGEKMFSPVIRIEKKRIRFEQPGGNLIFSGPINEKTISTFVEKYWYWEKSASKNPVPPSSRAGKGHRAPRDAVDKARLLYERFTGHDADEHVYIDKPVMPDVMCVIGDIDGVLYTTVRDGKTERYKHDFKKNSRPLFCVSPDGLSLYMIGGSYEFGERGIVDKE